MDKKETENKLEEKKQEALSDDQDLSLKEQEQVQKLQDKPEEVQHASNDLAQDESYFSNLDARPEIDVLRIDLNAIWVVRRLKTKGFEAYLTGGCVRDLLLGRAPKDFDVATSAKPEEVKTLFRNCRLIGRRFLLAHVFFPGGKIIETATFRANPVDMQEDLPEDLLVTQDNVFGTVEEDAKRRDFTINGLFYDPVKGKVHDFVGAKDDLEKKVVCTIGDPDIRLREDPVRILRGIKFAARLGFSIEEKTLAAMKTHSAELARCAPSRLQEELVRLLASGNASVAIELCRQVGVLDVLMPELTEGLNLELEFLEENGNSFKIASPASRLENMGQILKVLDEISARECHISSAVAFAAILLPVYKALEASSQNERNWIDKLCINWAERIRLTRRDQDKIRLLLSTVLMMSTQPENMKQAKHLISKIWFREALLIHIVNLLSQDMSLESVGKWKALADEAGNSYRQEKQGMKKSSFSFRKCRLSTRSRNYKSRQNIAR